MPGKQDTEPTGEKVTPTNVTAANSSPVVDNSAIASHHDQDKYEPPATTREITQTDRLNKQLLESLLNRMQAAAQATVRDNEDESNDNTASPRNSIDWE